jgi:hypothetical protein
MGKRDPGRLGHPGSARTKKRAIVAIFVMATFVLTALLSVPSHFFRLPLQVPPPIRQAIVPFEPLFPTDPGGVPGQPRIRLSHGVVALALRAVAPQPPFGGLISPTPNPPTEQQQPPPPKTPSIDRRRAGGKKYYLPSGHDPRDPGCASSPHCIRHGPPRHHEDGHDRDRRDGKKDGGDHHGRGDQDHGRKDRGDWKVRKEGTPGRPGGPGGPGHRAAPAR